MTLHVAIIGAGLAGVTAARHLIAAGHTVSVFDKSRGLGGRLATRRREGFAIDHGAPRADASDPDFRAALSESGAVRDRQGGWIGQPGMSGIVRAMAGGMTVTHGREATAITEDGTAIAFTEGPPATGFDRILCTAPAPQAARLLHRDAGAASALARVEMAPVWTLLLAFDKRLGPRSIAGDGVFAEIICNSAKPGRTKLPETWVAHARPDWTRAHLEDDRAPVADTLWHAFAGGLPGKLPEPVYLAAHRWRYGLCETPLGAPCLPAFGDRVLAGGDWALGRGAEDAFTSGRAMARHLIG